MAYQPLPMGWTDIDRRIHAYLHLKGPKTASDLVDELNLYPDSPRNMRLQHTYRRLKRMRSWDFVLKDKDMATGKIYWHYAFNGQPQIYVNPSYEHREIYASERIEDAQRGHKES